jgi:hypothetical protein
MLDFVIVPEGQFRYRLVSDGELVASGVDRFKAIQIALKRVRQAAVKGPVVIRFRGVSGEDELQDRLAEARATRLYPAWWENCEWHLQ